MNRCGPIAVPATARTNATATTSETVTTDAKVKPRDAKVKPRDARAKPTDARVKPTVWASLRGENASCWVTSVSSRRAAWDSPWGGSD